MALSDLKGHGFSMEDNQGGLVGRADRILAWQNLEQRFRIGQVQFPPVQNPASN